MEQNNELVAVIEQQGLQPSKVDSLMQSFAGYFTEAKKIAGESKSIVVSDETQVDDMHKAREYRLKLKEIRVNADKTREELKSQSLREGNAIQGVFNIIKALIVPVEEYLEKQEKFAEVKEAERIANIYGERVEKLSKYVTDVTLYNIRDMADEVFENLLSGCKSSWEKARADEAKTEADRLAQVEANRLEQEKIRKENEKLRAEAEEKDKALAVEREEQAKALRKVNEEKEKVEAKLRAEKEAQAKKEADEKAVADAKLKADEEAKRKSLLAPDKEKLLELANIIDKIEMPNVASDSAGSVIKETKEVLNHLTNLIREKSKTL
jgi:hypothetical protein